MSVGYNPQVNDYVVWTTELGQVHKGWVYFVASAVLFLLNYKDNFEKTWGNAKCPKFNIVGAEELDNLKLAQIIAQAQDKKLNYEMVDFHSSRPGHDLRYALDGNKMRELGWTPDATVVERLRDVTAWTLQNERWL